MARKKRLEKQTQRADRNARFEQRVAGGGNVVPFHKKNTPNILPKNLSQEDYLYDLADPSKNYVFAIGPAGTGKTLLCTLMGIKRLMNKEVSKIIITRPAVSVDEEHGFLPGDLNDKMAPWVIPIMDVFEEYYSMEQIEDMLYNKVIEIAPLAYMRGRTFKDAWIIADECQLTTDSQMKMLLTRLGQGSKMVITGDLDQADRGHKNGLKDFLTRYNNFENSERISVTQFQTKDIERHPAVEEILKLYKED